MDNIKQANPAPIGLIGFGMTTVILNIHNAGFFPLDATILAMGLTIGGVAQIIAGILEFQNKSTFKSVAFTSYGFFWISLVLLILMPKMGLGDKPSALSMGFYLSLWGTFTLGMFIATLKSNTITKLVFGSLLVLFALLAIADFTGSATLKIIAGYEGIVCGLLAMYDSIGQVINDSFGRKVVPL